MTILKSKNVELPNTVRSASGNSFNSIETFASYESDMTTLSRESRTSLDSGFADELRSRFSRSKSKMKQKRKFNKTDISNPLGDVKHLYHIGSSGKSFGDISADMSKAISDLGKGPVGVSDSVASTLTPSYSLKSERIDSDDTESQFDEFTMRSSQGTTNNVNLRQPPTSLHVESCRKSTISFNFELDTETDDIMSSVLAVMDQLQNTRFSEEMSNLSYPEERIYDEVPPLETPTTISSSRSVTITVEETTHRKPPPPPNSTNTNKRPNKVINYKSFLVCYN